MNLSHHIDYSKVTKLFNDLKGPEAQIAVSKALTDAGFEGRKVLQAEMEKSFNGLTPYMKRSIQVEKATPEKLLAIIEPKYMGGKGVDPKNVLHAEIFGGNRKHKASERAFASAGILPGGYSIVPGQQCPLDQYGNIKAGFIVQLISYFQAFGEQGYKSNMTKRRKANLAKAGKTESGYKTINGVAYFVSYGKLRSGAGGVHLPPGIWSKTGIHGVDVKPILMFVRQPSYRKRLDFFGKPKEAAVAKFNTRLRFHMRTLLERRK